MRFYLILAAGAALLASLGLGGRFLYGAGADAERLRQADAIAAAQAREADLAERLEAERRKKQEVVRETITRIQNVPDPSGCAAIAVPAERVERMRQHHRDSATP